MTVEELLQPRYKVIAPYPRMELDQHGVGDIISPYGMGFLYPEKVKEQYDLYPHLFKKLQWWEDRNSKDMPLFIKEKDGRVWSIKNWGKDFIGRHTPVNNIDKEGETENFASISWHFNSDTILPTTKEEYESYINKQQP